MSSIIENNKTNNIFSFKKTNVSLLVSSLLCSVTPAFADCVTDNNQNGGVNITCDGDNVNINNEILGPVSNNVVTFNGNGSKLNGVYSGGYTGIEKNGSHRNDIDVSGNITTLNKNTNIENISSGRANDRTQDFGWIFVNKNMTLSNNHIYLNDNSHADLVAGGTAEIYTVNNVILNNNSVTLNDNSYSQSAYAARERIRTSLETGVEASKNNIVLNNNSFTGDAVAVYVTNGELSDKISTALFRGNNIIFNDKSHADTAEAVSAKFGSAIEFKNSLFENNSITMNNDSYANIVRAVDFNSVILNSNHNVINNDNIITLNDNSHVKTVEGFSINLLTASDNEGNSAVIDAKGNIINLNDNSYVNTLYVGKAKVNSNDENGVININDNIVNINDNAKISDSIYGGFIDQDSNPAEYDIFSGNTLNFSASPVNLSGSISNFETYNFSVDPALANTDVALITANDIIFGSNDANLKSSDPNNALEKASQVRVTGIRSGEELFAGDTFVLIQAGNTMSGAAEGQVTNGVAQQGISLLYEVQTTVDASGNRVTATILNNEKPVDPGNGNGNGGQAARVNPQLKALSEGHLASAMMLTRGADALANDTVHTIEYQNPQKGLAPFINLSGGKNRYNSGSRINAKDGLLTGGISYQTDKLTGAVMIESGWGSYDTHNGFATQKDVNGDGHNRYVGAAVLGQYNFDSGMYTQASLRTGKNRNTFDTKDIQNLSTGEYAHYNLDSNYLGSHIGIGYNKALDDKNTADVSVKYLWTHLKGKDINVAGDTIHFDDINSQRVQINGDLTHNYSKAVAFRTGLGFEYELDGKAKSSTYGYDIAAPGVKDGTTILTVGSTVKPLDAQPLSLDVNVSGYTGKRDGIGGSIKFGYAF